MRRSKIVPFTAAVALSFALASPSVAQTQQIKSTFVRLGPGVPGVMYEPAAPGDKAQIAIFVMHSGGDYLAHSACTEMSKRGYRVLCANNTTSKAGTSDDGNMDRMLTDAKFGVAYLRRYPGVRKVVLLGHSGGGALMATYQNVAENGTKACRGSKALIPCSDSVSGLPAADGLMLIDSNWGLAAMMLFSVDPAVTNEDSGLKLNPALDLFNPQNGFRPEGSTFSDEFVGRFLSAAGKRNNQLILTAQARLAAISKGQGNYKDDEGFLVPGANFRGGNNRLFSQDIRLMSRTHKAWPLLRADGSTVTEVIHSVRVPENAASFTGSFESGALKTTLRSFLSTFAVRVNEDYSYNEDTVRGIDWASCYSCPPGNIEGVTVPLLTMGMTGHWEYLAAETIYEHAKSSDKTLAFVEGATHLYTTCVKCEKYPGQFGDTQKTTYDYVDTWLSQKGRFY
jgi:hypothetical protein